MSNTNEKKWDRMAESRKTELEGIAQAVEPVGMVTAHRGIVAIKWVGKCPSVGTPLFTHPVPPATTTRPLAPSDKSEFVAVGVTGKYVRVRAFNDRPAPPPAGERRTMIALLRGFGIEILGKAADMLEADNKAQQVAAPILVPLTAEQAHEALTAAGVGTFFITQAVTRKERWLTEGSTDVMSIVRALEVKHGIKGAAQ